MKNWVVPSLGVFLLWGIWGFLPKLTVRYVPPRDAVIYEVLGGVLFASVALLFGGFRLVPDWRGITLAGITGLVGFMGALLYLIAVARGPVSLVSTLSALYPVIAIVLAFTFLGETITLRQGLGVVLALVAILLIAG